MGSCGCVKSTLVDDDRSGGGRSLIEQHLCSELPVQQSSSEEAVNLLESDVDLSVVTRGCTDLSSKGGHADSVSFVDVPEISGDALASECENVDASQLKKTLDDDCRNRLRIRCWEVELSGPKCGGLCSEENFQDERNFDVPSVSLTANALQKHCAPPGEQKDDESNIFSSAEDSSAVAEGKKDDAFNCMFDFRHSEMSLESEPMIDLLVDCHQQHEQEEIMRNADPFSKVVDKCDALGGMEADACKHLSPSHGREVPSGVLCTEVESTSDQPHDQKDGEDWNSSLEERIKDSFDKKESIMDKNAQVLSSLGCHKTLGSTTIVDSPCEPTLLDQGNDINLVQIEDNFCKLKDCSSGTAPNCTFRKPFYPDSGQPSVVLITNSSVKDMPNLLSKGDDGSINYNIAVNNPGKIDNEGKDVAYVDCITKSVLLPSQKNSQRTKVGRKTQTKKASRKCKNKASVPHPSGGMKIILKIARKKRSCFSKPARSSIWGLLGNIKQTFEQDNELGISEARCQGLGKARSSRQRGKAIKNGASSCSSSSVQKCSVSTTRLRLKIKLGKEVDLSCSNVLIPEAVDGFTSASYLASGSGCEKVASNADGKFSKVVALGKFESFKNNPDKVSLDLDGRTANSHLESSAIMAKSDGNAEELCLVVPPERVVEALIEPINNKGMDPGTSPDSEVINSVPEVQGVERHQEDAHHAIVGSSKEFNAHLDVTSSKRGKKKDKHSSSSHCITEDGSQGPPKNNRSKHSKNHRCKKNFSDAVGSLESSVSTEINASIKSESCEELSVEPLPLSGEIELVDSGEALKVKSCMEAKSTCNPAVDPGFSEYHGSENLLSSARSLGHNKAPKSPKPSKVNKTKSKASDSISRKKTTCGRREKQRKPIKKSEVKGKGVFDKVTCEVEDHPHTVANFVVGNHKLDDVEKINPGDKRVSVNESNLDMLPGVGLGEQHLSPHNAWVRCDGCHKWRRIPAVLADQIEETNRTWTCKDSSDKAFADCAIPQEKSNAEINAELGLSDGSAEEDAYEDSKNYKELKYQPPLVSQESTFTRIFTNEFLHRSHKTQTIDEIMVCHCKQPPEGKLGCGDECLNRMLNIECVQGTCPCGDCCSNQQFQKREYASLKWFKCGKKGYGLKAIEEIAKGQFLIEYVGEVLDIHAYEARQREYALKGHRHFYFMTLNGSEVIDASAKGNLGRFINHSCDPNCRTEKWMVNGEICIGLFALRDIKQDEELTFDYNYVRVFGAAAKKCYCGSPHCRGYIGGDLLNAEVIVHSDSDEEFPEPVMLTEDGEIEDDVPIPKNFNNVVTHTARLMLTDRDVLDKSATAVGPDNTPEKESYMNPASAISLFHSSSEVEDSRDKLLSSVQAEEISQQKEDVTSKPMPAVQHVHAIESELVDKTSSIQRLETTSSLTTFSKVLSNSIDSNRESKSEIVGDRHDFSQSHLVKTPRLNGSLKKGKVRANPPNGIKAEVTTNQLQVSSMKLKKVVEDSSNSRFEAVQEKLNELLDGDGGISKRKDATKGYLKLLLLTVASGDRSNGEAIQRNRDISMILDALLKTKSRAVLNDIINKNGLQMLHNIMKQYRRDFKKIPILRKLLKVLEYLAASKILAFEHINGGPPCHGMESFRESMLSLTEHDDKQVHQIARSFRDRWIPRPIRKHGYMDRDDNKVESLRSFNSNRLSASHNHRRELDVRPTQAIDCVQQSMLVTTPVDAGAQEGCSALSLDGGEMKETKKRKRKSRWDQPAETNSCSDVVISSVDERQNIPEDVPPGFSCPLGSINAALNPDLALQNVDHSRCPSEALIGHQKEKFNSDLPLSYGMPWSVAQQYGTPHAEIADGWVIAPGVPFYLFPPPPPYPRVEKDCQPSNTTNAMEIDQPAEVGLRDTGGLVNCCSDDMISCISGADPENTKLSYEDNKHVSKRLKGCSNDLGTKYFRQQKWNNSRIPRPWFRRDAWKCSGNNSSGGMCSIGVGNVANDSKDKCHSEDSICRAGKGGNSC